MIDASRAYAATAYIGFRLGSPQATIDAGLRVLSLLEQERILLIQEQRIHGLNFPRTLIAPKSAYYFREIYPRDVEFLLCDPEPVLTFDLTKLTLDQIPKRFSVSKPIMRHGQIDGICMYFKATFDDDISFSTGPDSVKTHWPMLLYRTPVRIYRAGEIFEMQVEVPGCPSIVAGHGRSIAKRAPTKRPKPPDRCSRRAIRRTFREASQPADPDPRRLASPFGAR